MYRVAWFYFFAEWFGEGIAESRDWSEAYFDVPHVGTVKRNGANAPASFMILTPLQKQRKE
jgi:hypothetical protein